MWLCGYPLCSLFTTLWLPTLLYLPFNSVATQSALFTTQLCGYPLCSLFTTQLCGYPLCSLFTTLWLPTLLYLPLNCVATHSALNLPLNSVASHPAFYLPLNSVATHSAVFTTQLCGYPLCSLFTTLWLPTLQAVANLDQNLKL